MIDFLPQREVFIVEAVFETFDFFKSILESFCGLSLLGDVDPCSDKLDHLARRVQNRVPNCVEVLDRAVRYYDAIVSDEFGFGFLRCFVVFSDPRLVIWMHRVEKELDGSRLGVGAYAADSKNSWRNREQS